MYECGKLKKVIGNKFLFPVFLEQCDIIIFNSNTCWTHIMFLHLLLDLQSITGPWEPVGQMAIAPQDFDRYVRSGWKI